MDPALWELMEHGEGSDEVAAIIRVQPGEKPPPYVREIARFGPILTVRLHRADIRSLWNEENIASVKAPRLLVEDDDFPSDPADEVAVLPGDQERLSGLPYDGSGVVIGILDWGFDFDHPEFLNPDGSTRLLALWDQRGPATQPDNPYGYGRMCWEQEINAAQVSPILTPYTTLGYHPAEADPNGRGSHGTHVAGIAAGNTRSLAPGTRLVFVHLSISNPGDRTNLGDSVSILEGIDFIRRVSDGKPLVINISAGRHGGPHDGLTLVEQGIDYFLTEQPGRAICQSTGNYFQQNTHAAGQLRSGETHNLIFQVDSADLTPNEVEIWYPARDEFVVRLQSPDGSINTSLQLGQNQSLKVGDLEIGNLYHRSHDPNNGDHHINLFLYPQGPAGDWRISLYGKDVVDGRYHAWIERDATCPGCQGQFHPDVSVPLYTTGTICNGFHTIAVGAYNPHLENRPISSFSSSGPTRDGRLKPNILAPGVAILSARSAPKGAERGENLLVRMTGTSMAAPAVTSVVALMFEAAKRPLPINETRRLLLENTKPWSETGIDQMRAGNGYLDPIRAVQAAAMLEPSTTPSSVHPISVRKELDSEMLSETNQFGSFQAGDALEAEDELGADIEVEDIGEDLGEEMDEDEPERPCPSGDCGEEDYAETIPPIGNVKFGGTTHTLTAVSRTPDYRNSSLDEALRYVLRQGNRHSYITGSLWTGNSFEVFLCQPVAIPGSTAVVLFNPVNPVAIMVLNGSQVYIPSDPLAGNRSTRWVRLTNARDFYGMGHTLIDRQRRYWIDGRGRHRGLNGARQSINIPGVTVNRGWLRSRSMPELRLLLAHFSVQVFRVLNVNQTAQKFLGGEILGLTLPPVRIPMSEPECYLPVIAEAEGLLEAVNAYDLGAGLSVGPTQFNCIEGYLFRFLKRVWDEDIVLFNSAFSGLNWSMRDHNGHPDLVVNAGTPNEIVLHGIGADRNRNVGYFHSGVPGNHQFNQINAAFRQDLVGRFRTLVVWPHIQDIIVEIASQTELAPALPIIHSQANQIPAINTNQFDCDLFVLKALLLSAYIRYSACLRPILQAMRQWNIPTDKLTNWQTALQNPSINWGVCNQNRRTRLISRLQNQQTVAIQVCQAFRALLPPPPVPATVPTPTPTPAQERDLLGELVLEAEDPQEEAGTWLPDPADLEGAYESIPDNVPVLRRNGHPVSALAGLAGELLTLERAYPRSNTVTSRKLVEEILSITGAGRDVYSGLPAGLPPIHTIFDTFVHGEGLSGNLADIFQVVGFPGRFPIDPPRMGDLLVRHGENGFGHTAFLLTGELIEAGEIYAQHLNAEIIRPGWYAQVVEGGTFPHSPTDGFCRRVYDAEGRLPSDTLLLRLRLPELGIPGEEWLDFETGANPVLPIGKGMWVEALRGSASPQEMRERMRSSGLAWLAIKLEMRAELGLSGAGRINPRPVLDEYLRVLRQESSIPHFGIWLWGWSEPWFDQERFSSLLISRAVEVGAQGVIVDAEGSWRSDGLSTGNRTEVSAGILMNSLLRQAGAEGLSVGVTTFTGITDFPWESFSRAHFGMPQIYERRAGLSHDYPSRSVEAMQRAGFREIIPVSNAFNKRYDEMEDLLRRTPVPSSAISWWVWHAANHLPERWRVISEYQIPMPMQIVREEEAAEQAVTILFVVRNRLINERIASVHIELVARNTISASGTTNANGQVRIALTGLADGDYILRVTPPSNTTDQVGPNTANTAPRPDRIWRPLNTTVTLNGGRVTASQSADVTVSGNTLTIKIQPVWMRSPNRRVRASGVRPRAIVAHHTGGAIISGAIHHFLAANSTSAHYVIDVDGQVLKMVHEDDQSFHAGCSHWGGSNGVNGFSVGIEIVNAGGDYPDAQYTALIGLIRRIRDQYTTIPVTQIPGHSDIATCEPGNVHCNCPIKRLGRKSTDPGVTFDWSRLEVEGLGVQVRIGPQPDTIYGGFYRMHPNGRLQQNDNDAHHRYGGHNIPSITGVIAELQNDLRSIGYYCPSNGTYDVATQFTIRMFQEHFFAGARRSLGTSTGNVDWATASMIKSIR